MPGRRAGFQVNLWQIIQKDETMNKMKLFCFFSFLCLFASLSCLADSIEDVQLEKQREDEEIQDQKLEDDRLERQREDQKIQDQKWEDDRLERQREDQRRLDKKLDDERWDQAHGR